MRFFDIFRRKPRSVLSVLHSSQVFQQQKEIFDAMTLLSDEGVDADEMPNGTGEYGMVVSNPIPCKTVFGSTAYLGRLRAADGTKVTYERLGSTQSSVSPHPIDVYEVAHSTGRKLATLYISPYQKRTSEKAPKGFVLAENSYAQGSPAKEIVTEPDGTMKYYSCGILHRDDGPAVVEVYANSDTKERHRSWYRFGLLDRENGPAVIGGRTRNGQYEWWQGGVRHRDNGPAVIELIDSYEFGEGPVYEWWHMGVRQKVQDGNGIIYYFRDGENVLTEFPDGCREINRDGEHRFEDQDGTPIIDFRSPEDYDGYLETHEFIMNHLYNEPESTFDKYNPY